MPALPPREDSRAETMHVLILYNAVAASAPAEELDVLRQVVAAESALTELGHRSSRLACGLDLKSVAAAIMEQRPDAVFNLVESLGGTDRLMPLATVMLEGLGVPFTGGSSLSILSTSNKLVAKQRMVQADIPTPAWLESNDTEWHAVGARSAEPQRAIVKAVAEHASLGITRDSVVSCSTLAVVQASIREASRRFATQHFAEEFVCGREFNLSLLADGPRVEVLPPAEIEFLDVAPDEPRIVGYAAKWVEESAEYAGTPRRFEFAAADSELLRTLSNLSLRCWDTFGLRGWARVDFRVDEHGRPWVLEVNVNPCLSPDAGFAAAVAQAGYSFAAVVQRILGDLNGRS